MDKKYKTPAQKAQAAIEYIILLGVIVSIVLISFARVMPRVNKSAEHFFNETTNIIIDKNPVTVCTPGGWTAWTACPPCGGGSRTRACTDTCGVGCSGAASELCYFIPCPPINGGWCPFGPCNGACGASPSQSRTCNCPAPSAGGQACVGPTTQQCPPIPCPIGICQFLPWQPDPCPVLCGGAVQTRDCLCDGNAPPGATCLPDAFGTGLTTVCNPQGCVCPATSVDITCGTNASGGTDTYTINFPDTGSNTPPQSVICPPLCYGTLTYACVDGLWNYSTALCEPSCSTGIRDGICDPGLPGPGEDGVTCPGDCCDANTGCGSNHADPSLNCRMMCGASGCQPFAWINQATVDSWCDDPCEVCVNYYVCGGNAWICGPTVGTWSPYGSVCFCGDGVCQDASNNCVLAEKVGAMCNGPGACPVDCSPCCGDGARNASEECDGSDFGGDNCVARGYDSGSLYCRGDCITDLGGCCNISSSSCSASSICGACMCGTVDTFDNCGNPCTVDCGPCPVCGDGSCTCETCAGCPADCGGACVCGNGSCDPGEDCSCSDCPSCFCGDGVCTPPESCTWCYSGECGAPCCGPGGSGCSGDGDCCSACCYDGVSCGQSSGNCF